jgi:hypothetical protein
MQHEDDGAEAPSSEPVVPARPVKPISQMMPQERRAFAAQVAEAMIAVLAERQEKINRGSGSTPI